jgi:hypothetical protein
MATVHPAGKIGAASKSRAVAGLGRRTCRGAVQIDLRPHAEKAREGMSVFWRRPTLSTEIRNRAGGVRRCPAGFGTSGVDGVITRYGVSLAARAVISILPCNESHRAGPGHRPGGPACNEPEQPLITTTPRRQRCPDSPTDRRRLPMCLAIVASTCLTFLSTKPSSRPPALADLVDQRSLVKLVCAAVIVANGARPRRVPTGRGDPGDHWRSPPACGLRESASRPCPDFDGTKPPFLSTRFLTPTSGPPPGCPSGGRGRRRALPRLWPDLRGSTDA